MVGHKSTVACIGSSVSAWIDPYGEWWETGECGHYSAAYTILTARGVDLTYGNPVDMLEDRGWVHVSYGCIIYTNRDVTEPQRGAIAEAVSHIILRGLTNAHEREFVTSAAHII